MNTPRRTIRIEDELWTAATDKALEEDTTVTEVIRTALRKFVATGAVVVLAVLALTACGSQDDATLPAVERSASPAPSVTPTASEPVAAESEAVAAYVSALEVSKAHEGEHTATWAKAVEVFRENAEALTTCETGTVCYESALAFIAAIADEVYLPLGDMAAPDSLRPMIDETREAARALTIDVNAETIAALTAALAEWDQYRS